MIILSTIDELKKHVSTAKDFDFEAIAPSLRQAARKRVIPVIGKDLATEMETFYNGGSPDQQQAAKMDLLNLLQEAVANFGLELYVPEGNVMIGTDGISVQENDHARGAEWWRVKDLIRKYAKAGEDVLEEILDFLEEDGSFTAWNNSDQKASLDQFFITSAGQFQKYFNIGSSRATFWALQAIMQDVQNMYLEPTLGIDFMEELRDIENPGAEEKKAQTFARQALAKLTISRACRTQIFTVQPEGFRKRVTQSTNAYIDNLKEPQMEELNRVELETAKLGNAYLQKLTQYLNQNASDTLFPTWKSSEKYVDPSTFEERDIVSGSGIISF